MDELLDFNYRINLQLTEELLKALPIAVIYQ